MFQLERDLIGLPKMQQNAKQDTMQELNVVGILAMNVKPFGNSIKELEMPDGLQTDKGKLPHSSYKLYNIMSHNLCIWPGRI